MNRTRSLRSAVPLLLVPLALLSAAPGIHAFCGFYVAQGDAKLFNRASKVAIARDGDRTVITMASDYLGDPKEFAVVVPVPVVLQKGQVHVGEPAWIDHLDNYSVPRLVEYWDPDPCPRQSAMRRGDSSTRQVLESVALKAGIVAIGGEVSILASYKVDEYDILILSATEGRGLDQWLQENGYRVPGGASAVLQSYIRQGMYFFVAKVNLQEQKQRGYNYLRPIQVAYESPKFMLPIRLGMVNADGAQELFVFTLTRRGRVEATNYRTVRLPTGQDVPEFVQGDFPDFYRRLFGSRHRGAREEAIFLEYAWNVVPGTPSCDPCTAPYLTPAELRSLGAYWIPLRAGPPGAGAPGAVVLTRLHLRYDAAHFPEDLVLQETGDRENWQARYVIHHPYRGPSECPELTAYWKTVWDRRRKEAENYCELTGAAVDAARRKMGVGEDWSEPDEALIWWERIWRK